MLNNEEKKMYSSKGFVAPIDIYSLKEISQIHEELEFIENRWPEEISGQGRNNTHLILTIIDTIVHNRKILDAVESIIGKNILVTGTTLFIKDPETKGFVSWHQDAKYIGFDPNNFVTAWLALTEANQENGCMWMWQGSHKKLREHKDQFEENNLLTRGQTVENVSMKKTEAVILKAGQMSLHHPRVVHGSGVNKSKERRIGFVIQSYIGSNVKQVLGKMYVQQARGEDCFNYHDYVERPKITMVEKDNNVRKIANEELSKIFYKDLNKKGKY